MAWRSLTDKQWELVKEQLPKRRPSRKAVGRLLMTGNASRAYSGFYGPVLPGVNCPKNMEPKARSTADSKNGRKMMFS